MNFCHSQKHMLPAICCISDSSVNCTFDDNFACGYVVRHHNHAFRWVMEWDSILDTIGPNLSMCKLE